MTISSENQANTQTRLRRTATWQIALMLILFVLMSVNTVVLSLGEPLWQGPVLATIAILRALFTLVGLYQVRQNKIEEGAQLVIGTVSVTFFLTGLLTGNNISLVLPLIILLSVVFLASGALEGAPRRRAIIFGVIFAALTASTNFVPLSFRVIAPVQTEALLGVVGVLSFALAFFIVQGYGNYPLSVKMITGFLVVGLIAGALSYLSHITATTIINEQALPSERLFAQIAWRSQIVRSEALEFLASGEESTVEELAEGAAELELLGEQVIAVAIHPEDVGLFTVLADNADDVSILAQNLVASHQETLDAAEELEEAEIALEELLEDARAVIDEEIARNLAAGDLIELEEDAVPALAFLADFAVSAQVLRGEAAEYVATGEEEAVAEFAEALAQQQAAAAGLEETFEAGEPGEADLLREFEALETTIETAAQAVITSHEQTLELLEAFEDVEEDLDSNLLAVGQAIDNDVSDILATTNTRFIFTGFAILGIALFLGFLLARGVTRPVSRLVDATQKLAAGDLSAQANVDSRDEIGLLGSAFNGMAARIRQTLGDLQASSNTITTSADISRQLSTILDPALLTSAVVEQLKASFDYYHAHIYLLDEGGENLVMAGGTGEVGQALLAQNHQISLGKGLVGQTAVRGQATLVPDVTQDPNWLPNPLLPDTQAELAVPIALGGRLLGVLDVQNDVANSLGQTDVELLETIAGQVAIGLQNASLFESRERAMTAMRQEQDRADAILESIITPIVISGVADGIVLYVNEPLARMIRVPRQELIGEVTPDFYANPEDRAPFLAAIRERGVVENYELQLKRGDGDTFWTLVSGRVIDFQGQPALLTSLVDISDRKTAEARTAKLANELTTVAEVGVVAATLRDPNALLQSVADLTKERFDLYHTHLFLVNEQGDALTLVAGAGEIGRQMLQEGRQIPLMAQQSLVASVARSKSGAIRNYSAEGEGFMPHPLLTETRAEMAVPILLGEEVLGVLDVRSTQPGFFGEADMLTYQTLATQVAVALQNARSFARSEQALSELQELSGRLIRSGWQEFAETLGEQTAFAYGQEEPLSAVEGDTAPFAPATTDLVQPLAFQGEEIGKLILSAPQGQVHDVQDIMAAVAERLSVHLENLRLSQQTQQRSTELAILNEMSQTLTAQTTVDGVFQTVYDYLSKLMVITDFYSVLYEEESDEVIFVLTVSGDKVRWYTERRQAGHGVTEYVIRQRQPLLMPENVGERLAEIGIEGYGNLPESWLGAPIVLGDRVLGVIGLESYTTPRQFNAQHLNLLTAVANQAAIAIESTRLLEGTVARAEEEQILRQITTRVSTAVDAESILRTAAEEIGRALGLEGFVGLEPVGSGNGANSHNDTNGSNGSNGQTGESKPEPSVDAHED